MSNRLFFIDASVFSKSTLRAQLPVDSVVIELNGREEGLQQIANAVAAYSNLDSIHLFSYGEAGAVYLGANIISGANLSQYNELLTQIGNSLSSTGDFLLYGSNIAKGEKGAAFITQLAQALGADVTASTDASGVLGDWVLEAQQGQIDSETLVPSSTWWTTLTAENGPVLISQSLEGFAGNSASYNASVSADGRFVSFESEASNLVADDTNNVKDVFQRDTQTGITTLIAQSPAVEGENSAITNSRTSSDGHFVLFESEASDLVAGDTNNAKDIFLRDTQTGITTLVSQSSGGVLANAASTLSGFSANGRYALFESAATNLVSLDNNGATDVFLRDLKTGITHLISKDSYGTIGSGSSSGASMSADGRYVVFESSANYRMYDDNYSFSDIFLRDMHTGEFSRISSSALGIIGNNNSYDAHLSENGRSIVFSSEANNLAAGDANTTTDIYAVSLKAPEGIYDGRLSINGIAVQNQVLTAQNTFADINASGRISYQWLASGYDIYGATSNTLTLAQSQVGKAVSVKATYTDTQGITKTILAMATDRVANVNDPVTGQVTISGITTQHQTLTAVTSALADLDGIGSLYYQWFAGSEAIHGATASTFTLTQAQVGKTISVKVSYTDWYGAAESVTSSATRAVANANDAPDGGVTISGTVRQGQILTAANTLANDPDGMGTISYQWLADGRVISGATGTTLTLTQAHVGKAISVQAIYTDGFNTREVISSAATNAVANVNDAPTGSVTVSGTTTQGRTLIATQKLVDADGLGVFSYQWLADGVAITDATASTFTLTQAQVGKAVSVKISYTDLQGTAESVTSAATRPIANANDTPTGGVTISGTATQGQLLTAANTLADADGLGTIRYQWLADGKTISGATASTFTLTAAQAGKAISVKASYTDGYGTAESVTSAATSAVLNVNDAPTGGVTIRGTATQGQLLTAANTLADADGLGTIRYQWLADGVTISGATASTFTLTQAQVGKAISVKASYTDGHGTAESVTSNVLNANSAPTGSVTVSGTATKGQTLTASHTLVDADGLGTLSYQWLADGVAVRGATASTFVLGAAQVGKAMSVKASYTDLRGTAESVTSSATGNVLNANSAPTGSVTIAGVASQGQILTASHTLADADGLGRVLNYQWLAGGVAISGATANKFTLTQSQVGKAISVKISYTDLLGTAESVTSATTRPVYDVNNNPTGGVIIEGLINGKALFGHELTANNTLRDTDGIASFNYQWLANGVAISGATSDKFTPTSVLAGKNISVKVQYTDALGVNEAIQSSTALAAADIQYGDLIKASSNDRLSGGVFSSELYGYAGNDVLHGDSGDDTLYGGIGNDVLQGADDNDRLSGDQGNDSLYGGVGNDSLYGGTGRDSLYGGNGDDILDGSSDIDFMDGGNGADLYYVDNAQDAVRDTGTDSLNDVLYVTTYLQKGYVLGTGVEEAVLTASASNTVLTGNAKNNVLTGNNSHNLLKGGAGADTLKGDVGDDTLIGGAGNDSLLGGAGNDVFKLEKSSDSGLVEDTRDVIEDFTRGQDKLNLLDIDANVKTAGDQAFTFFISSSAVFTQAGQLQFKDGVLYGNTDTDTGAEFSIALTGVTALTLADIIA